MVRFRSIERPYAHLQSLRDRKILLVRLMAGRWLEQDAGLDPALDRFRHHLLACCSHGLTDDPGFSLSRYLRLSYRQAVAKQAVDLDPFKGSDRPTRRQGSAHDDAAHPARCLRKRMVGDIRKISCQRCASRIGTVCADRSKDERLLRRGECLRSFQDLFEFTRSEVERVYRRDVRWAKQLPDMHVGFKTRRGRDHELVEGTTAFPDADGDPSTPERHADVEISLPIETFGIREHYQLLYILFHELVVHVPEQALRQGRRETFREDCGLTEGAIDAVAHDVALAGLKRIGPKTDVLEGLSEAFEDEIRFRHLERTRRPAPLPSESTQELRARFATQSARWIGRGTMRRLETACGKSGMAKPALVRRFLLGINILPMTRKERQALLAALDPYPNLERQADLVGLMRDFVENGDWAPIRRYLDEVDASTPKRVPTSLP